jgi:hypothetical protein
LENQGHQIYHLYDDCRTDTGRYGSFTNTGSIGIVQFLETLNGIDIK